jgi:hypothetical protein
MLPQGASRTAWLAGEQSPVRVALIAFVHAAQLRTLGAEVLSP